MVNRYKVTLTQAERDRLTELTRSGKSPTAKFIYARALLLCDAGEFGGPWKVSDVAAALGVTPRTVEHLKQRFVEEGLMRYEIAAWQNYRNNRGAPINWRFTTENARIKLSRLYPKF